MSLWSLKRTLSQVSALQTATGVAALNVLHLTAPVPDGDWVGIGGRVYECDDQVTSTITAGRVRVPVFTGHASGTLNFYSQANVQDGNTVMVGGKTYTFRTVLTNVDGYVKIGPTTHRSIYNLVAALNVGNGGPVNPPADFGEYNDVGEGPGVAYAAATTKNPADVRAGYGNDFDLWVSHRGGGAVGGWIALGASLVGDAEWDEGDFMAAPPHPGANAFGTALVNALNSDPLGLVWAEKISASEVVVWSRRPGDVQLVCTASFSNGGNAWEAATLGGGVVAREGLAPVAGVKRVVTTAEAARQRLHFVFGFEPTGGVLQVRSGAGAHVSFDGALTLTGRRVTVTAATVPITAGQVFHLVVWR